MRVFLSLLLSFIVSTSLVFAQENGFTFNVDDVPKTSELLKQVSFDAFLEQRLNYKVYSFPQELNDQEVVAHLGNGFLSTVEFAYNHHRPLELSPDVVWLLICQGFGDHVTAHSDSLEFLLLNEDHPDEIEVRNDNLTYTNDKEWSNLIASFGVEIDAISKDEFKELVVQEFSTTTPTISTVYRATHLDIAATYVGLRAITMCGFPSITLSGTPDDWRKIYNRVDGFSKFGLEDWIAELKPVLQEFVDASEGNPNIAFWKSFYKTIRVYDVHVISGWILKFYPYIKGFKDGYDTYEPNPYVKGSDYLLSNIGSESLPKGYKRTKIDWVRGPEQEVKDSLLLHSGFLGILQNAETGAIQPNITWVITSRIKTHKSVQYSMFRHDIPKDTHSHAKRWNPEVVTKADINPVYKPDMHDSFEIGVADIQKQLIRSGLFKSNDHPKIYLCVAHEGTVFIQRIEGASQKQEEYIRELIGETKGQWAPAKKTNHNIGLTPLPTNFMFVLTI